MAYINRHIVEAYSDLFEGLNTGTKIELIESLSKSLKVDNRNKEQNFFKSFGGFISDKSANAIAKEIRKSRKFRKKDFKI